MDTTPSTSTSKRRADEMVDPDDGTPITNAKKSRGEIDTDKKLKVLRFIIGAFIALSDKINPVWLTEINITAGNQVTNILFSIFNILRQDAKQFAGNVGKKAAVSKDFTITSRGQKHTISLEDAKRLVTEAATAEGLEFKAFTAQGKANWYGTAGPYLDFFTGHALRYNELRLGHSNMPIKKEGDASTSFPVSKYGLNGSHHVLLKGSNSLPEKRASMAQSVGPMTALLCLIRTKGIYRAKWTYAAKRAMAHIPIIDEILTAVQDKPAADIRGLIGTLADILLITTSRQAQRMFFPLVSMAALFKLPVGPNSRVIVNGVESLVVGGDERLKGFNVSGTGGFYTYMMAVHYQRPTMEGEMTALQAAQIFFHCVFGTYKEDLSILEQITGLATWNRREEFGSIFQGRGKSVKSVRLELVPLLCYSKLSSANQTGLLASTYSQTCAVPVFSGRRTQHYGDDFFEQLNRRTGTSVTSKTIPQLTSALMDILNDLRQELLAGGRDKRWEPQDGKELLQ